MKRKVLILSCNGGGGHSSAAKAMQAYLADHYNVHIVDALGGVLATSDPIYYISFKRYTGQDLYNFLLRYNCKRTINIFLYFGYCGVYIQKLYLTKLFNKFFKQEKPDLIISVIPLVNAIVHDVCATLDIPYLLVPTDLDIRTFIRDLQPPFAPSFKVGISFDYPEIYEPVYDVKTLNKHCSVIGFPIRASFFEHKNYALLREYWKIPDQKSVIMLVMGAMGSSITLDYIKALSQVTIPFHLIICIGRNYILRDRVNKLIIPEHISSTIIDDTVDISDIMAISDACITKPGSVTFAETLYMHVPTFLDQTSTGLIWEKFNIGFAQKHSFGVPVEHLAQIVPLITEFLTDERIKTLRKDKAIALNKKTFGSELQDIVYKLLHES